PMNKPTHPHENKPRRADPDDPPEDGHREITEREVEGVEERSRPRTPVIYEVVRRLGEEEMDRPAVSLWWSGGRGRALHQLLAPGTGDFATSSARRALEPPGEQPWLLGRLHHGGALAPAALHREHHHGGAARDRGTHRRERRPAVPHVGDRVGCQR